MRSSAEVEREVEASRNDLDRTVEALRDKMTPGQLFDEASRALGGTGQQVLSKFVEQAKENPMPLAVMGLGLAWLMTSNRSGSGGRLHGAPASGYGRSFAPRYLEDGSDASGMGETHSGLGEKVSGVAAGISEKVSGVKERLSDAVSGAGQGARRAADNMASAAGSLGDKAGHYGHQAKQRFDSVLESEPLLLGAIGLAVGTAIGAALPHTAMEDRTVGPMRDKLLDKGKALAGDGMRQAGGVAQAAYETVKSEVQSRTTAGESEEPPQPGRDEADPARLQTPI